MIYAVTGAGPRTGTSFVMEKLHEAGLPVYWTLGYDFPDSKYEIRKEELFGLSHVVAKVWPRLLSRVKISRMVVLKRDRDTQIESLTKQIEREREAGWTVLESPERMIDQQKWIVDNSRIPKREYRTEELDDHIDEIVSWLSEPFKEAVKWQQQQQ
jgi:hypothetical protein